MNDGVSLGERLRELARRKRNRIGIGVTAPTKELIAGFERACEFCEPVIYGVEVPGFESVVSPHPEEDLFKDLEAGSIAAAVRGQIHAGPFRKRYVRRRGIGFNPAEEMIPLLEFPDGRPILISPASNFVTGTFEEKERLIQASIRLCRRLELPVRVGVLARCRAEDLEESAGTDLEKSYRVAERLVELHRGRVEIKNYGIDFEEAYRDGVTILIEPDGTTGNQVTRTLYFLEAVRCYGAPYVNADPVVVETLKNSRDYPDVLLLASALANTPPGRTGAGRR